MDVISKTFFRRENETVVVSLSKMSKVHLAFQVVVVMSHANILELLLMVDDAYLGVTSLKNVGVLDTGNTK